MRNKIASVAFLLCCLSGISSASEQLPYTINNGRFIVNQEEVPAGCFAQLMTELNGDNHIAAVYLTRPTLRGCLDANSPHPDSHENRFDYEIIQNLGEDLYQLRTCQSWDEGTLRGTCDNIVIQFVNRTYTTPTETLSVLSAEKRGEW